jgi:hypothetical protein
VLDPALWTIASVGAQSGVLLDDINDRAVLNAGNAIDDSARMTGIHTATSTMNLAANFRSGGVQRGHSIYLGLGAGDFGLDSLPPDGVVLELLPQTSIMRILELNAGTPTEIATRNTPSQVQVNIDWDVRMTVTGTDVSVTLWRTAFDPEPGQPTLTGVLSAAPPEGQLRAVLRTHEAFRVNVELSFVELSP